MYLNLVLQYLQFTSGRLLARRSSVFVLPFLPELPVLVQLLVVFQQLYFVRFFVCSTSLQAVMTQVATKYDFFEFYQKNTAKSKHQKQIYVLVAPGIWLIWMKIFGKTDIGVYWTLPRVEKAAMTGCRLVYTGSEPRAFVVYSDFTISLHDSSCIAVLSFLALFFLLLCLFPFIGFPSCLCDRQLNRKRKQRSENEAEKERITRTGILYTELGNSLAMYWTRLWCPISSVFPPLICGLIMIITNEIITALFLKMFQLKYIQNNFFV